MGIGIYFVFFSGSGWGWGSVNKESKIMVPTGNGITEEALG